MEIEDWNLLTSPKEILDILPYGISIQTIEYKVLYENKAMTDLVGHYMGKKCFTRWSYLPDYNDAACKDCPLQWSLKDNKVHVIVRKLLDKKGNDLYIEITHIPILNDDSEFTQFIEIVKNVTDNEEAKLLILEDREKIFKEMYLGLSR